MPDHNTRLVITGIGPVTPCAIGVDKFEDAVFVNPMRGNTKIVEDTTRHKNRFITGVVDVDEYEAQRKRIAEIFEKQDDSIKDPVWKRDPKSAKLAQVAADLALRDSGLLADEQIKLADDIAKATELHSAAGSESILTDTILTSLRDKHKIPILFLPAYSPNCVANRLVHSFGITGLSQIIQTACAGAISCLDNAIKSLREPGATAKLALVGSVETDAAQATALNLFNGGGKDNSVVHRLKDGASDQHYQPYDKTTQGVRLSEGSGYLVVEELEHAKARGAKIYAEVVSTAQTTDITNSTSPDGEGLKVAMETAIAKAGINKEDISFIQVHGSGNTESSDQKEINAIKSVFSEGEHWRKLKITANKARHGHTLHNSAFVNLAELALSLKRGEAAPNLKIEKPLDSEFPMTGTSAEEVKDAQYGMAFGLGIGSTNGVAILKKCQED